MLRETNGQLIIGLSEIHSNGTGDFTTNNNNILYYAGWEDEPRNGVT